MTKDKRKKLIVVHSLDEIPSHFDSEDEEREWWWEHELSDELWDSLPKITPEQDLTVPLPESRSRRKRAAS